MAKSENQGLQIAVIIFAFLTIALSIATFYFFNDGQTQLANSLEQQKKAQENQDLARAVNEDNNRLLRDVIGHAEGTKAADAKVKLDEQLTKVPGVTFAVNDRNYIKAIEAIRAAIDQKNQAITDLTKKGQDLEAQLRKIEADYTKSVETAVAEFKKRNDDYETQVKTLQAKDTEHVNKVKDLEAKLQEKRDELTKATDELNKQIAGLQKDKERANAEVREIKKKEYERENWVFERPDATIVSISPKTGTVNIDVGRKDFLRLNIQFAVFSRGETNVHNRKKKGMITVTKFIDDGLAEARVIDSDLKNPILQGDVVFTPTWTPGNPEHFVMAGDFDVNNDKKSDNALVRTLVEMNGGLVEDEVSIGTRYLLLGDAPADKKSPAFAEYDKRRGRAKELSIKIMGLQEFLEYSGSAKTLSQLVSLGNQTTAEINENLRTGMQRELAKSFQKREQEGGPRRAEPGSPPRASAESPAGEGVKKSNPFPPRRNTPVQ